MLDARDWHTTMKRSTLFLLAYLFIASLTLAAGASSPDAQPSAKKPKPGSVPNYPVPSYLTPRAVHADHNPILSDGTYYSADPAPVVVGDTLYILAGRDEAPEGRNDFIMKEWQILATKNPASKNWIHYAGILRPEVVFKWAGPGRAYASQIVKGADGRFYLYAPVMQAKPTTRDGFGVGVAVSDTPLGPWTDAHPAGPIASQSLPASANMQNIDPTVLIDDDGRVYMYWGTFGNLRGVELEKDMVTLKGDVVSVTTLKGFFEAPWLFKRKGTYYMAYAGNNSGPDSECTPALYHACIAYGTATSPLGPWTYRGVMLAPVSSTTSHPGIIEFKGKWYIAYHTADAKGGGHFRRSVAIDEVKWDDSVQPPAMKKTQPTPARPTKLPPQRNIAPAARASASNEPIPTQYWIAALNDGRTTRNPLPPQMWGTWNRRNNAASYTLVYEWDKPVTLNGSRILFWADRRVGSGTGVAAPKDWHLEYWTGSAWQGVPNASAYDTSTSSFNEVSFDPVKTQCLRAVLNASSDGKTNAGLGVQEWETLAPSPVPVTISRSNAKGTCPAIQ